MIFGLTMILVTIFAPGGIQNLVRRIGRLLRGSSASTTTSGTPTS
jgi:hypothetical protein